MTYHDIDIPLPAFIAIDWIGMTLALIPIILRFLLRRRQPHPPPFTRNLSDALVLLSWLSGMVLISINTWKNSLRQRHLHDPPSTLYYGVPRPLSAHLLYVSWISLFFIYISLWAAKFALLAFYASLMRLQGRRARAALVAAATFAAATFALHVALLTRWCSPTSSNWDARAGRLCSAVHDIDAVTISTAANVATDVVILALPLFALAHLRRENNRAMPTTTTTVGVARMRMSKAELSGLAFVLCMAALSITAALARFITLELVQRVPKASITHTIDVWALVEIVASLVAVCLPSCRAFVRSSRSREGSRRAASRDIAVAGSVEGGWADTGTQKSAGESEVGTVMDLGVLEEGEWGRTGRQGSVACLGVDVGAPAVAAEVAHASSERLL